MKCFWCGVDTDLILGECFDCRAAKIVRDLIGFEGKWVEYDNLSKDIESNHYVGYVLKDTLYLYGASTGFLN
jgi:hypothetical protein